MVMLVMAIEVWRARVRVVAVCCCDCSCGEYDSDCDCESDWHPDCSGYYGMCVLRALRLGLWMIGRSRLAVRFGASVRVCLLC